MTDGLLLDLGELVPAPTADLNDLLAGVEQTLQEAAERWPAGTPGGLGGQFKPGYAAGQFLGAVTPKNVGDMAVGDHFVSPKGNLYKLVQKSDKTEWAKAINLDTGKPYPVKQGKAFHPVPHEAITTDTTADIPAPTIPEPPAAPEVPEAKAVDFDKAVALSMKLGPEKLKNLGPSGQPRNVGAMSSEKLVATAMHPQVEGPLWSRVVDELAARGLTDKGLPIPNAGGPSIPPPPAAPAPPKTPPASAPPIDAPAEPLPDAVGFGGLQGYGSSWGPGGKFKYETIASMPKGQVFLDKKGQAWKVKVAGPSPVISNGSEHFAVDGTLKVKAAQHAKSPVVFEDKAGDAPKGVEQSGVAPAEPVGTLGKMLALDYGEGMEIEGYSVTRMSLSNGGKFMVGKDGKAVDDGAGLTSPQQVLALIAAHQAQTDAAGPGPMAHPSVVEMAAPMGWKNTGGPTPFSELPDGAHFHVKGQGFVKVGNHQAVQLSSPHALPSPWEAIVPSNGPIIPMEANVQTAKPVPPAPKVGDTKGFQAVPKIDTPSGSKAPAPMVSLALAPGDVVQLKKGGWKYTLLEPHGAVGGWKAKSSNGKLTPIPGYKSPLAVQKADGSRLTTQEVPPPAQPAAPKSPETHIADVKAQLVKGSTTNIGDLPDGSVIATPDGQIGVLHKSETAYQGYVTAYNVQTGAKFEPPAGKAPVEVSTDPAVMKAAAALLKKAQTPTETTVAPGVKTTQGKAGPPQSFVGVPSDHAAEAYAMKLMDGKQNLTPDMRAAVKSYTASGYTSINAALRNSTGITDAKLAKRIKQIDKAIAQQPEFEQAVILSRKTSVSNWLNAQAGDVIHDNGFLSTSTWGGTWSGEVQLRILCPPGTQGLWVNGSGASSHPGEKEVILPRGTHFHILKRETTSGATVLYVEVIT